MHYNTCLLSRIVIIYILVLWYTFSINRFSYIIPCCWIKDFQFHFPLCTYCLPILYKPNLRMIHQSDQIGSKPGVHITFSKPLPGVLGNKGTGTFYFQGIGDIFNYFQGTRELLRKLWGTREHQSILNKISFE